MTSKKTLCVAGKNRIAVESLRLLIDSDLFEVMACPNGSDAGIDTWQPSFLKAARTLGVPVIGLDDATQIEGLVFLSLEFDKLVKTGKFKQARLLNVHFSLLPAYKGCFTSIWPLYYGEKETGVTLHEIDDGIDTGPIIDQQKIPLDADMTARQLYERYQDAGLEVVSRNLASIARGDYSAFGQKAEGSSYFSRKSLQEVGAEINFRASAEQVKNTIRSMYFPEYQTATFGQYRIASCKILNVRSCMAPGTVLADHDDTMTVATVDFDVLLTKYMGQTGTHTERKH